MKPYTETKDGCTAAARDGALGMEAISLVCVVVLVLIAACGWIL